jgi:ABC-2 type transport system ATP-binding protein/lipopolysaccharide transport system ATP-binding protein
MTVIEADGVGKRYLLGEDVERRSLRAALGTIAGRRGERDALWSLRDVTFSVADGESLGIIGRNGAGKTTMLRLIGRITEPTEGVVRTRGRVGSLLEVGTGFHAQLTGRENIYLNGAVLGLRRRDIERRFDEIVAFAGFERFLDTPIKRYSSGMQLRLAFAVAAHIDTDILLVDEVLAVGDAEFQRRCMTKVRSVGEEGRTVVFVSHDLDAVAALCSRCLWLDGGRIAAIGPTSGVIDRYLASGLVHRGRRDFAARRDAGPVALASVAVLDADGSPTDAPRRDRPFTLEVEYVLRERTPGFDLAVSVSGRTGMRILEEALSSRSDGPRPEEAGRYRARVVVPPVLRAGEYTVNVWAGSAYDDDLAWEENVLTFRLEGNPGDRSDRLLDLGLPFEIERLSPA